MKNPKLKIIFLVWVVTGVLFLSSPVQARRIRLIEQPRIPGASFLYGEALEKQLEDLPASNWYSRTAVIPLSNGMVQAVKFLRKGESLSELEHEARMLQELREKGIEIAPLLASGADGKYIFEYQGRLSHTPAEVDSAYKYISYIAPREYFIYPEDIKDLEKMKECAMRSITQFTQMLQAGYLHKSLSPLTHERNSGRQWLWNYSPIGGIENPAENLSYSNMSLAGLRDFAHVFKLDHYDWLYFYTGQALCEWAITITYSSLKNGFSDSQIVDILAAGFEGYLSAWGLDSRVVNENLPKLEAFIRLFRQEIDTNAISSQNDGGIPTADNLIDFVGQIMTKAKQSPLYQPLEAGTLQIKYLAPGSLIYPRAMVKEGDIMYVLDWGKGCLVAINLEDGSYTDLARGSLTDPRAMVQEGDIMYVLDGEKGCLVAINLEDGSYTDLARGSLMIPYAMVKEGDIMYVADWGKGCLVAINLENGSYTDLARGSLIYPRAMVQEGDTMYVADGGKGCLVAINLEDGSYTDLARGSLISPYAMVKEGDIMYVLDGEKGCPVAINLEDGSYTDLARGSLMSPYAMVKEGDIMYVADGGKGCLVAINLENGSYTDLAGGSLTDPRAMVQEGDIMYVLDGEKGCLVAINLEDGSYTDLAGGSLIYPRAMVQEGDTMYVADGGKGCLVAISLPKAED